MPMILVGASVLTRLEFMGLMDDFLGVSPEERRRRERREDLQARERWEKEQREHWEEERREREKERWEQQRREWDEEEHREQEQQMHSGQKSRQSHRSAAEPFDYIKLARAIGGALELLHEKAPEGSHLRDTAESLAGSMAFAIQKEENRQNGK